MRPNVLLLITLGGTNYYYGTYDHRVSFIYYESRIVNAGTLSESQEEERFGKTSINPITIELDNSDGHFSDLMSRFEFRGAPVIYTFYNNDTSLSIYHEHLIITDIKISSSLCTINATKEDMSIWDKTIPQYRIEENLFSSTTDEDAIGKGIPVWFGECKGIPLYSICEAGSGDDYHHDYLIGHGPMYSVDVVYRDGMVVSASEYTFYDGSQSSPYGGYAYISFEREQRDSGGNLYEMTADIKGIKVSGTYTANPISCMKEFFTNTTWGLSLTADSTTFNAIEPQFASEPWHMSGGFWEFKKAGEWRDIMLLHCRLAQISSAPGSVTLYIPSYAASSYSFTQYNSNNIVYSEIPVDAMIEKVDLIYDFDLAQDEYKNTVSKSTGLGFGGSIEYYAPFMKDSDAASSLCALIKNRYLHQDKQIEFEAGSAALSLEVRNVITFTHPDFYLTNALFEIIAIDKNIKQCFIKALSYSNEVFNQT